MYKEGEGPEIEEVKSDGDAESSTEQIEKEEKEEKEEKQKESNKQC